MKLRLLWLSLSMPFLSAEVAALPAQQRPDILLILLDDLGVDVLDDDIENRSDLPLLHSRPLTTAVDEIRDHGIRFTQAWVNDVCSPTRSAIHTGRYAFRTGIGSQIIPGSPNDFSLPASENIIPEMLEDALGAGAYLSAVFGKWHMQHLLDADDAPVNAGYDHFDGTLFALNINYCASFTKVQHSAGGSPMDVTVPAFTFLLSDQVDSCQAWIDAQLPT